ncbi:peptide permease [Piscirickettsia litoralis]|uniref:Peptide permease n=2 Tax=Piscirickettsia litoralis TaxID=1891921 RepID=A0ABX3A5E3_9GAMM|nr:peptide permease [Piscirickettsia litoralis]
MILMWEYFSYYGMRALLVLYLTQKLLFSDQHAYALYGGYTSLVYVTPIIGGILADRYLGYRWAVILGALLMVIGHITLGLDGQQTLYIALAFIICGYGLFKTNISVLLGELYQRDDSRRDSGFAILYVGGNIGAFLAPLACAYVAQRWGWHYGFGLAGIGMALGLLIFLYGRRHFINKGEAKWQPLQEKGLASPKSLVPIIAGVIVGVVISALILYQNWTIWCLALIGIVGAILIIRLFMRCNAKDRRSLISILLFMVFGLIFWAFDQQGGSSISLFIERNVDRHIFGNVIPAAAFQSINPFAILIGGVLVVGLWRLLARLGMKPSALFKLTMGMIILTLGFFVIALGAHLATATGQSSMLWVVLGLSLIGFAELFIDPVAMAEITRLNPAGSVGFLAGVYMLVTGSFANYIAAQVASLTSVQSVGGHVQSLVNAAEHYYKVFDKIAYVTLIGVIVLIIVAVVERYIHRRRHLT